MNSTDTGAEQTTLSMAYARQHTMAAALSGAVASRSFMQEVLNLASTVWHCPDSEQINDSALVAAVVLS